MHCFEFGGLVASHSHHVLLKQALQLPQSEMQTKSYRPAIIQGGHCQNDVIPPTLSLGEFTFFSSNQLEIACQSNPIFLGKWGDKKQLQCCVGRKNMINMSKQIPITPAFYCATSVCKEVFLSDTISKDVYNLKESYE